MIKSRTRHEVAVSVAKKNKSIDLFFPAQIRPSPWCVHAIPALIDLELFCFGKMLCVARGLQIMLYHDPLQVQRFMWSFCSHRQGNIVQILTIASVAWEDWEQCCSFEQIIILLNYHLSISEKLFPLFLFPFFFLILFSSYFNRITVGGKVYFQLKFEWKIVLFYRKCGEHGRDWELSTKILMKFETRIWTKFMQYSLPLVKMLFYFLYEYENYAMRL